VAMISGIASSVPGSRHRASPRSTRRLRHARSVSPTSLFTRFAGRCRSTTPDAVRADPVARYLRHGTCRSAAYLQGTLFGKNTTWVRSITTKRPT
jgi:hypothetical protein